MVVNFGFIVELPNWLKPWEIGASCKSVCVCRMSSAVQWVIVVPCWEMGVSLETTCSGRNTGDSSVLSRDHMLLPLLHYRFLCVCGGEKWKTMFSTRICIVVRHFEARYGYFLYMFSCISDTFKLQYLANRWSGQET